MNKFVCTVLLLSGIVSSAWAQVALVPKAGINLARIAFDQADNNNTRTRGAFVGGIGLLIGSPSGVFSLQPEVLFTQKGYQGAATNRMTINYIEIPVMGRLSEVVNNPGATWVLALLTGMPSAVRTGERMEKMSN